MTIAFRDDEGRPTLQIAMQVLDGMRKAAVQEFVETANIRITKKHQGVMVGKGGVDWTATAGQVVAPVGTS